MARGKTVAPARRKPTPASKSAAFNNGTFATACKRFNIEAVANGWPRITDPYVGLSNTPGVGTRPPNTRKPPT